MNHRYQVPLLTPWFLTALLIAPVLSHATTAEGRFFAGCPRGARIRLHDERRPFDLHAILYTAMGVSELEIFRLADWTVDLLLLGARLRPFERTFKGLRAAYHRLPPWAMVQRTGQLVDVLQIPELSLGDAASTYSAAVSGEAGPGSGMLVRFDRLVDWSQRVVGDVNRLGGRLVGRDRGLVTWSVPERLVDGTQWLLLNTAHHARVLIARALESSVTGLEMAGEQAANIGRRRSHRRQTVFLRVPIEVYRAHELWILEHRPQFVVGPPELFRGETHAVLAHGYRPRVWEWEPAGQWREEVLVLMTTERVIARAPEALRAYVVPAAWVLGDDAPLTRAGAASKLEAP